MTKQEYLDLIDSVNENGKYKANWASLSNHKVPEWYMYGKVGVFIHWAFTVCPHTETNGIQEICMIKTAVNTATI